MRKIVFIILTLCFLPILVNAKSGITASFKAGYPLSGTSFGIKLGLLNPYGGIDILKISGKYSFERTSWEKNYQTGYFYKDYYRKSNLKGSATLIIPHIGLKFYLKKAYLVGELLAILPSISGTDSGERYYYNSDGTIDDFSRWDDDLSSDDKKMIKDALDFTGIKIGFGAEHFFSDHFSIGGEFGFRILSNNFEESGDDEDYYYREKWKNKVTGILGVTYTAFSLNFIL